MISVSAGTVKNRLCRALCPVPHLSNSLILKVNCDVILSVREESVDTVVRHGFFVAPLLRMTFNIIPYQTKKGKLTFSPFSDCPRFSGLLCHLGIYLPGLLYGAVTH
jgi:hypothetical protein